ncbi:MAG: DEAD/DEAH box helicase [Candidatus Micrarchaeota archaeon]
MLENFSPKWFVEEPVPAKYDEKVRVDDEVWNVLQGRKIKKLYSHQAEAINAVRKGKNIVLMAPTASGKTECYMIPVVEAALRGKCSLLLFPTKALSRDQWARIREFNMLGVRSAVYDGDTPPSQRVKIRKDMPHVIISNVDMLHFMLAHNKLWGEFFSKLKYVVVDEIHAYSGTLGSHVANLMWRMKRIANNDFQFIASSATIGNALEFASKICGKKDFVLIEGQGAPRGRIKHAIVNETGESVVTSSLKVAKEIGKKSIIFGNSHNMVERLGMVGKKSGMKIEVYRSGLPPDERRKLEAGFHSGRMKTMAATSALELGMDIGDADAAILAGFPGTVTRFKQRVGRVGRKGQQAYAIYVARGGPLDQYYATNPKIYLQGKSESCYAKGDNEFIRKLHLLSAAKDRAIVEEELGEGDLKICMKLREEGLVRNLGETIIPTREGAIVVRKLSMRNAGKRIRIVHSGSGKFLGEREISTAIGELYPGAIYLIGGRRYVSLGINLDEGVAKVKEAEDDGNYFTQALREKNAEILEIEEKKRWGMVELGRGKVHISNEVYGYLLKDSFTGAVVSRSELKNPLLYEFDTNAFWADWDVWAEGKAEFGEGLHALEHVSIAMMPALTGADPSEIGGISHPSGRVFYYEGIEGGSGLSEIVMPRYGECIEMARRGWKSANAKKGAPHAYSARNAEIIIII